MIRGERKPYAIGQRSSQLFQHCKPSFVFSFSRFFSILPGEFHFKPTLEIYDDLLNTTDYNETVLDIEEVGKHSCKEEEKEEENDR